jgi:uncharacterized protein (DUF427 family)
MRSAPIQPGPGEESVWDYPRPPRVETSVKQVRVVFGGITIAETDRAIRILETSSPPVYYLPAEDVRRDLLVLEAGRHTFCEWKGVASYYGIVVGDRQAREVAWSYPEPSRGFEAIRYYVAFYPGRVDGCYVDDELVQPQPGGYYGGWITHEIVGPFKGAPGTEGW